MHGRSGIPLAEICTNLPPKENQKPTSLRIPSAGSHFVEGTGSDKDRLQGITTQISGCTHDGSSGECAVIGELDGLLEELESEDEEEIPVEEEVVAVGAPRNIPDYMLQTDLNTGLMDSEVKDRRRQFGLNQMKEEKRSHVKQFLLFFVGPIQFVMEVDSTFSCCKGRGIADETSHRRRVYWLPACRIGWI